MKTQNYTLLISYVILWQASEVSVRFYMEPHSRQLQFSKKNLGSQVVKYQSALTSKAYRRGSTHEHSLRDRVNRQVKTADFAKSLVNYLKQ